MELAKPSDCASRDRLEKLVQHLLQEISRLSREQIDVVSGGDEAAITALDKRIENAIGEKERALGALHQHRSEHGC